MRLWNSAKVIVATVVIAAGLAAPAANASTAATRMPTGTAPDGTKVILTASGDMAAGSIIRTQNGTLVTLPKEWSKMTISDLASIGVRPSNSGILRDTSVPATGAPAATRLRPDASVQSCSGLVCMLTNSSGRTITSWYTTAYPGEAAFCTFAVYWAPTGADILDSGNEVCDDPGGSFVGFLTYPVHFNSNYHACNTWIGLVGKPCVLIS